jgi:hypothetical protein
MDPVLKFLFDQDREELLRLMLGAPVSVVGVMDSVLPAGEQRSDGVVLVEDAGEQFVLHVEFMTRVARNMGERIFGYVPRIFQLYGKPVRSVVLYLMEPSTPTRIETEFRPTGTSGQESTWSRCWRCLVGSASVKTWYLR